MRNISIDAIGTLSEGEYGRVDIDGIATCEGDLKAERLDIDGKFKCFGTLTAELVNCDGMAEFTGNLSVGTMDIDGMLVVTEGNQIDAHKITCDGSLHIHGQISTDVLEADGIVHAQEIVGDRITIDSNPGLIIRLFSKRLSRVDLIEATTIRLSGVSARAVNGQDVYIGPYCEIEEVDCTGTLSIDATARVGKVTGNSTRST